MHQRADLFVVDALDGGHLLRGEGGAGEVVGAELGLELLCGCDAGHVVDA